MTQDDDEGERGGRERRGGRGGRKETQVRWRSNTRRRGRRATSNPIPGRGHRGGTRGGRRVLPTSVLHQRRTRLPPLPLVGISSNLPEMEEKTAGRDGPRPEERGPSRFSSQPHSVRLWSMETHFVDIDNVVTLGDCQLGRVGRPRHASDHVSLWPLLQNETRTTLVEVTEMDSSEIRKRKEREAVNLHRSQLTALLHTNGSSPSLPSSGNSTPPTPIPPFATCDCCSWYTAAQRTHLVGRLGGKLVPALAILVE